MHHKTEVGRERPDPNACSVLTLSSMFRAAPPRMGSECDDLVLPVVPFVVTNEDTSLSKSAERFISSLDHRNGQNSCRIPAAMAGDDHIPDRIIGLGTRKG